MLARLAKHAEETSRMRTTEEIRQRGDQRRRRHGAMVVGLPVAAVVAVLAIGSAVYPRPAGDLTPAGPGSTASTSAMPTAPAPSTTTPNAMTSATPPAARADRLAVAVSGTPAQPSLAPGGPAIEFTVTLTNATGQTYRNITPIVSMGHCSCIGGPASPAPDGTLQLRQSGGTWLTIPYVRQGTGTDYLDQTQLPGITLAPGEDASFTYRLSLTAKQQAAIRDGQGSFEFTVVSLPAHTILDTGPVTTVTLTVTAT
jgi:hypothetical protein